MNESPFSRVLTLCLYAVCAAAIVLGVYARFQGLAERPFSEDEYYWATSVDTVAEQGVPAFPDGGYYTRALTLQYLEAGVVKLFGGSELVHRLPAAIFGILTIPLFFVYARQYTSVTFALAATALLAISAWEIEFSRFARMYGAFQFFALAFLLSHKLVWQNGDRRLRFVPPILALVMIEIQLLGVFLLPLLFTPVVPRQSENVTVGDLFARWRKAVPGVLVLVAGYAWMKVGGWAWGVGVPERFPADFVPYDRSDLVALPLSPGLSDPSQLLAVVGGLTVVALGVVLVAVRWNFSRAVIPGGLAVLFITAVFHLLVPFFGVLAVLLLRYDLHRVAWTNRKVALGLLVACLPAVAWVAWAVVDREWVASVAPGNFRRAFRLAFLSFPDVILPGIGVWLRTAASLALIVGACAAWELFRVRKHSLRSMLESPVILLPYLLCIFGLFRPEINPTTRYWYMVYPVMLLVMVMAFADIGSRFRPLLSRRIPQGVLSPALAGLLIGLFVLSEDFQPAVIARADEPEVAFRMGQFGRLESHWYYRFDERTPAAFLNEESDDSTTVVISGRLSAIDHYINPDVPYAFYLPRDVLQKRYTYRSRMHGTRELWTGRPLLGTPDELRSFTAGAGEVFLVRVTDVRDQECDPEALWGTRLQGYERATVSRDGRVEVLHVRLNEPGDVVERRTHHRAAAEIHADAHQEFTTAVDES